jgi:hypothetical protein
MTMKRFINTLAVLSALSLAACIGEIGGSGGGDDDGDMGSGDGSGSAMPEPVVCEQARAYTGFGGDLTADRPKIAVGSDRIRIKPYAALSAEYSRVLGLTAFNTAAYAGVFGRPPARWNEEPAASASTIYSAFALAYDGCSQKMAAGGDYDLAPNATIADRLCRDFARVAWQREATDDEASDCATYAVNETPSTATPRTRWAYTCASVLTSEAFLTY